MLRIGLNPERGIAYCYFDMQTANWSSVDAAHWVQPRARHWLLLF
jgi:hypothetical protein